VSQQAFTAPATHWASSVTDTDAPPMGTRLRLQASFDISGFSQANQVILTALKKYGMILADNGSAIYISGAPDSRWNNDDLHNLSSLTGADFDVVTTGPVYTESNVPSGASPVIGAFNTSSTYITKGRSVTLSWSTSGAIYNIISPTVGPVRGTSITVSPNTTTTYTLYSTNQYGRSTATATVAVQHITVRR